MIHNEVANYVNNKRLQNIFGKSINVQLNSGCTEALCYIITRTFQTNWKIIKKNVAAILLCFDLHKLHKHKPPKILSLFKVIVIAWEGVLRNLFLQQQENLKIVSHAGHTGNCYRKD